MRGLKPQQFATQTGLLYAFCNDCMSKARGSNPNTAAWPLADCTQCRAARAGWRILGSARQRRPSHRLSSCSGH